MALHTMIISDISTTTITTITIINITPTSNYIVFITVGGVI